MKSISALPTGWIQMPLGTCGTWHGGGTPSKFNESYWTKGTIPWISPKDMKTFRITDSEDHLAQVAIEETNVKLFPSGTVLVVIRSGILSRTLPVAVSQVIGTMNQDLKGLCPADGIDSDFVAYFLQAFEQDILRKCSKHGTTVASIDTASLHSYPLSIAPLNEQRRIVAKIEELFSDLDAGIAALKRAKANLKRYRASVLKAAVEGKLTEEWRAKHPAKEPASELLARILKERRQKWESDQLAKFAAAGKQPPKNWREKYVEPKPPETDGLPELPPGWCWASVEQLTELVTKGSSPGWQGFDYVESGVLFLRSQNVRWGNIDLTDAVFLSESFNKTHQNSIIRTGDVLLNLVGASIGRSAIAPSELDGANTNQAVAIIRLIQNGLRGELLVIMLLSPPLQAYIAKSKADVARANFNLDDVRPTPIPLPGEFEQSQIIIQVEERLSQIESAETVIEHGLLRAARLRQSILKRAFEGKLVPQDPSDEPASTLLAKLAENRTPCGNSTTKPTTVRRKAK